MRLSAVMVGQHLLWLLGLAAAAAQEWERLTDQQLRLHLESAGEGTEGARAELLERKCPMLHSGALFQLCRRSSCSHV